VEQVVAVLNKNASNACNVVRHAVAALPKERTCKCGEALKYAIMTDPAKIPAETRQKLSLLLDKYYGERKAGA
jgi:5'-methylthioadenosine phosphorylase